jgi:hypothetical protein
MAKMLGIYDGSAAEMDFSISQVFPFQKLVFQYKYRNVSHIRTEEKILKNNPLKI